MFWLGAANLEAAARNSSQPDARAMSKTASAVRVGVSAVHDSATA